MFNRINTVLKLKKIVYFYFLQRLINIIFQIVYPVYKKKNVTMPRSCPFVEARDMYYLHETHKTEESYARWACEFCGKTFYAEMYLDNHLQNRHSDKILKVRSRLKCRDWEILCVMVISDAFTNKTQHLIG